MGSMGRVEAMTALATKQITVAWNQLQTLIPLTVIRTAEQYDHALSILSDLLEEVGENELHPLYVLLDTLGALIFAYEEAHVQIGQVSGREVLQYLMDEHALTAADLPEIGAASDVRAFLSQERDLTLPAIYALAKRFHVPAATFV